MTRHHAPVAVALLSLFSFACGGGGAPAGDAAKGRQAFVALHCNACHEVAGETLPPASITPPVLLGGKMLLPPSEERIRADILLPSSHFAVGYPSEQIMAGDRSRMPDYSKRLDDRQVADLVAFLKTSYQRGIPSATH